MQLPHKDDIGRVLKVYKVLEHGSVKLLSRMLAASALVM